MIFKEKEQKYFFILTIAITLVSGPLQLSSSSYVFYDLYTIEQTTTTHELYEKNNSIIKDLKIALEKKGFRSLDIKYYTCQTSALISAFKI